ncbi:MULTISPECIES: glycosyltransferase family 2 protein [Paenibacillus]|uniref:glycosyltransferase family 2 protein n=1 Tax=Paenibacillus TaxID=44249 RepID=UPI00089105AF|nr:MULTISPECIES: glycosyltransferase family 2 protein [Paenibacillus]SDM08060.1 Glycosyl transferase family 2 [Paenibacillus sp. OK060]SEB27857.1 Glycosyl transferase family 2 [Paenibacillus sp. 276b]SHN84233.1 Glycosyl transferase family 2 [Paenibacillus sp. ov031]SLK18191.1 Glycosyl transferase family 2 [Paenibacillus sp. RU5A]SOC75089.1 Glycosyl transferase family 2 [Paenibacillus sp. RU26A]
MEDREATTRPHVTLSMIVRNEEHRYLRQALETHRPWIDRAVIIDDGSTDHTVALCQEMLEGIPLTLIVNPASLFADEVSLRKQQWETTVATGPEWILNLDADEILTTDFGIVRNQLLGGTEDAIYFRLFDMWSDTHYREDQYWQAHAYYRPFLVRYRPEWSYEWKETPQHCGRFPLTIQHFAYGCHSPRVKHYGWARAEDRIRKYERYQALDPDARYGWKEQYESILDADPILLEWSE